MKGKVKRVSWMAGALLPLAVGITSAANSNPPMGPQTNQPKQQDQQTATMPGETAQSRLNLERAKDLIGAKVVNDKGERLGTVADVVLTPDRDAVNYVALSTSRGWGTADKYFAVPWSQIKVQSGANGTEVVITGVSRAQLDQAQGFDKNHWPATASENWLENQGGRSGALGYVPPGEPATQLPPDRENQGVTAAHGDQGLFTAPASGEYANPDGVMTREPPTGAPGQSATEPGRGSSPNTGGAADITSGNQSASTQPMGIDQLRVSKLIGTKVQDAQGQDIGKLDNIMIDVNRGRVAYGIVALRSGFLGLNKDYAPVPWSALDMTSQPGIAKLDTDKQTLMAVASDRDNFPNLNNPQYSRQLYDRFQVTPYWEGQNLGFVPGAENPNVNSSSSGMTAPKTGSIEMIAHQDKHPLAYNPDTVTTIHGTVHNVATYRIAGTSVDGVRLHVRTDDGRMMWVELGPRPYIDSHHIAFHKGDVVTVTGSMVKTGHHEAVVASQIRTPNRVLDLRTPDGYPLWNPEQYRSPSASHSYGYGQY